MLFARKQFLVSLAGLFLYAALAAGSFGAAAAGPVTVATILQAAKTVHVVMQGAKLLSAATSTSVNAAYADLGNRIQEQDFSVGSIQEMEQTYASIRTQADSLGMYLAGTRASADQLFELLERKAKENETPELRTLMMTDVKAKRREFNLHMEAAETSMARVNASVQKYRDILGFIQFNATKVELDRHIGEIQAVAIQADALDVEIQRAIDDGMRIIASVETST
jgi:hypothetical protein